MLPAFPSVSEVLLHRNSKKLACILKHDANAFSSQHVDLLNFIMMLLTDTFSLQEC